MTLRALGLNAVLIAMIAGCAGTPEPQRDPDELPGIAEFAGEFRRQDGYFTLFHDDEDGRLYLQVPESPDEFLYFVSLAEGVGSNPLGLDRGALSYSARCVLRRHGRRVLWVQRNFRWRAVDGSEPLVRSVEQSFPDSVLAALPVVAAGDGVWLVDATDFFLRDATDVIGVLRDGDQGRYQVDDSCSVFDPEFTRGFPDNNEISSWLTFESDEAGRILDQQAPDGRRVTVRQHHSLVRAPAPGYEPRELDPRVGLISIGFHDYARPVGEPLQRRWITRWRLQKANPEATMSPPVRAITFYLDPGVPAPLREAMREGAMWWNDAFEAAGFQNAFLVTDLPEGADPMDARYSTIQFVHRAERGWSIGASHIDPSTGEILKGAVRMDSHRARTDANLTAGYGRFADGCPTIPALGEWVSGLDDDTTGMDVVLARVRQLAAHEVGHTLGFSHNFLASTYGRASVMDYPAPLVEKAGDGLDLSRAYAIGCGEYDRFAVRYAYEPVPEGQDETAFLNEIVEDGLRRGMGFLTDRDARPESASHPGVQLWDNGNDPLGMLASAVEVRDLLLNSLATAGLRDGEPVFLLQRRLAPVYYHHQFAMEAAVRMVGGMRYAYAIRGDGQRLPEAVAAADQRDALNQVLALLEPEGLDLPADLLAQMVPAPHGWSPDTDYFPSASWPRFDRLGAARGLSGLVLRLLLNPQRLARLADQEADADGLGLMEALETIQRALFVEETAPRRRQLREVVQMAYVQTLIAGAQSRRATPEVRAALEWHARGLADSLAPVLNPAAQRMSGELRRHLNRVQSDGGEPPIPETPLTSPIGHEASR